MMTMGRLVIMMTISITQSGNEDNDACGGPGTTVHFVSLCLVTHHHDLSRFLPLGHFWVFALSSSKFYDKPSGENRFEIGQVVFEL